MSGSNFDKIKIKLEADILAEHEGLIVIATKINGKYSKGLLYINVEDFDSVEF